MPVEQPEAVSHARVFAIAGPAMLANVTTPLLGLVATAVIGRLGEAHLLGGVAIAAWFLIFCFGYSASSAWAASRSPRKRSARMILWSSAPSLRARS